MGIFAGLLIGRGENRTPGTLSVAGWDFPGDGKIAFLNMAVQEGLINCRLLLNFLGIYKKQKRPVLEARGPQQNFRDSEVWIERFPNGRLLTTRELCQSKGIHPITARSHIIRTLDAASRGVAHLTVPKKGSIEASKLKNPSYLITLRITWEQVRSHFYDRTLATPPPRIMDDFERLIEKHFTH